MSDVNALLAQMRTLAVLGSGAAMHPEQLPPQADFGTLLQRAVEQVNQAQQQAAEKVRVFEMGEGGADLAETMIALQQARISFQALVQVRNKVVQAYQDIMNMPL